jgi:hypothetical protein
VRAVVPEPGQPTQQQKEKRKKRTAAQEQKKRRQQQRRKNAIPQNLVVPKRDHEGKTMVCFASGPSLTVEVVEQIRPYVEKGKLIAAGLNDTYRIVPYLQEFYACDQHWWKHHLANRHDGLHVMDSQPDCRLWGNQTAAPTLNQHPRINIIRGTGQKGFSETPNLIHWGSNSGYQLLNLCYHFGVARILLVGYNMQVPNKMGQKGHHFFGPHQKPMSQSASYKGFVKQFHTIQGHIKKMIVNCTPDSALDCFDKADLQDELSKL